MTGNGTTTNANAIVVSNHPTGGKWNLVVTSDTWGGMTVDLLASANGTDWFAVEDVNGAVQFTANGGRLVAGNLYYKVTVASYGGSAVTVVARPS